MENDSSDSIKKMYADLGIPDSYRGVTKPSGVTKPEKRGAPEDNKNDQQYPDITPVLLQITTNSGCHSGLSRIPTFRSWMRSFLAYQDDKKYITWGNVRTIPY